MNLAQLCKIRTLPLAKCQNCNACTNVKYIGTFFFSIRNHFNMISNYFFLIRNAQEIFRIVKIHIAIICCIVLDRKCFLRASVINLFCLSIDLFFFYFSDK